MTAARLPGGLALWRVVRGRRAFLVTLGAATGALGLRVVLLPRPLSEAEIARLVAEEPTPSAPVTPLPPAGASPPAAVAALATGGSAEQELDYDISGISNPLAEALELGPVLVQWKSTFRINTVEREPQRGLDRWALTVDGLVAAPTVHDHATLNALGRHRIVAHFQCVEGWGVRDVRWDGVPLGDVLDHARPAPDARYVSFHTLGGEYTESLTLEQAYRPGVLLADQRGGEPLPDRQGSPLRLVVPFMFGYKSAKWVNRIELTRVRHVGYWERRGWPLDPYL